MSTATAMTTDAEKGETLLVLSDVHLGSDLDDYAARGSSPSLTGLTEAEATGGNGASAPASEERNQRRRSSRIDADLVALLRHYRQMDKRWRLVIAGDFIDFLGMVIATDAYGVETAPSDEERANGLGNAEDHARIKLQRVCLRHSDVFDELAGFVADGHALTLVHGNHDLELHWPAVQAEMKSQLFTRARALPNGGAEREDVYFARIEFQPWFFYRSGVVYIEHGHQYDSFCATDHILTPISPRDPRRIARGFCDVLLRHIVRPTRGMSEHGHETKGMVDYIKFGLRLGLRGMTRLSVRFVQAIIELFRIRKAHLSEAAKTLRIEHERRVAALAEVTRIGVDRLRALVALQTPPITSSVRGILASLLLDKLALAMTAATALLASAIFLGTRGRFAFAAGLVALAWVVAERFLARYRQLDPSEQMIDRAAKLAKLFPAAFVVMGHTHVPVEMPITASGTGVRATYVNLGSWAEEEPETAADGTVDVPHGPALAYRAARTHLIIHPNADALHPHQQAEFLTWDPTVGPKKFPST